MAGRLWRGGHDGERDRPIGLSAGMTDTDTDADAEGGWGAAGAF